MCGCAALGGKQQGFAKKVLGFDYHTLDPVGCRVWSRYVEEVLGVLLYWFQSFEVSRIQKSFNVFKRYWFHVTKLPLYVFWKILISYARS